MFKYMGIRLFFYLIKTHFLDFYKDIPPLNL